MRFSYALALFAAGALFFLARFWGAGSDYSDRFLILLGSGWLLWNGRGRLISSPGTAAGYLLFLPGCLAPAFAYYLIAQVGQKSVLLWWLLASAILATAGAALIVGGWRWLRVVAFPLVFLLFALPIPERIELPLQERLQQVTTAVAEFGLAASGVHVVRKGFELHLPGGCLEVVEACSGVRSITALLAIAAFVGHVRGFGLLRGLLLLGLALPVIAAVNSLRIIITGWVQEWCGPQWIQGTPHEVLGVLMVLVGLAMVLLLSELMKPAKAPVANDLPENIDAAKASSVRSPLAFAALISVVGIALSALAFNEGRSSLAGRSLRVAQTAPLDEIALDLAGWKGKDLPIPDSIQDVLTYDRALCRLYRDEDGLEVQVWVLYWQASNAILGYHHPDVCLQNRGWTQFTRGHQQLEISAGRTIEASTRQYRRERDTQNVIYWTQEGRKIWTDAEESAADRSGPGLAWIGERLVLNPPEVSARLTVMIVSDAWWTKNERGKRLLAVFSNQLAAELFRVCPWATPQG